MSRGPDCGGFGSGLEVEMQRRGTRRHVQLRLRTGYIYCRKPGRGGTSMLTGFPRLGVDDSVIQRILRHCTVATTQNRYIKTASPEAMAAMRQFTEALLCSTCAPDGEFREKSSVQ
jgi:integrase